jgi:hypothetical protein
MPNIVTPIRNRVIEQYPGAVVKSRGYDYITHDVGNGRFVFANRGGGLHYLDGRVWQEQNTDFEDSAEAGHDDASLTTQSLIHVGSNSQRKVYPRRAEPGEYFVMGRPEYWTGSQWQPLNLPGRVRSGRQLTWDSANIALEIQHTGHGIKYDVTLKNPTFATNVRWSISLTGLTWDNWQLISQSTGKVVAVFPAPTMIDADLTQRQVASAYDGEYITFTPDYSGLVYPIKIDPTFQDGYGGDVSTYIDTYVDYDNSSSNYGTVGYFQLYLSAGAPRQHPLLKFDVSSLSGATVTSATLYLYEKGWGSGSYTGDLHRILSANSTWTEAGATWDYATGTTRWAGDTGGDGGTDAGCSVSGTDYNASSMGTLSGDGDNAEGTEYTVTLTVSHVQAMIDDGDYGMVMIPTSQSGVQYICSSDHATGGYRPLLEVVYTEAAAGVERGVGRGILRGVGRGV